MLRSLINGASSMLQEVIIFSRFFGIWNYEHLSLSITFLFEYSSPNVDWKLVSYQTARLHISYYMQI